MRTIALKIAGLAMALVLVGAVVYVQLGPDDGVNEDVDPGSDRSLAYNYTLMCEMPGIQPVMDAPAISCPTITNPVEAMTYVADYFPEFQGVEFETSYEGKYIGMTGTSMVQVFSSGTIIFADNLEDFAVPAETFEHDAASGISVDFINNHGGMGLFDEFDTAPIERMEGNEQPEMDFIKGHFFVYSREYEGYTIFGADNLRTTVLADSGVSYFYRGYYTIGAPVQQQQVIPAAVAWAAVTNDTLRTVRDEGDINITSIELCYYIKDHRPLITSMEPCWRFSGPSVELYVNAFTGVFLK